MYIYLIVALAVLARFLPHLANVSPVYGALLFGGARLRKRESIWFPTVLLAASDFVLTRFLYHMRFGWEELIQTAAYAAIVMVGWELRPKVTLQRLLLACLAGAAAFYLISNFGAWVGGHAYPPTWAGLIECYVSAIPFFGRSIGSTVLFAGALFGAYELHQAQRARQLRAHARAS